MTRVTVPGAYAFAVLSGIEALTRSVIAAALPIQTQALFGNDESVSVLSMLGSVASLIVALLLPRFAMLFGRARMCALGILAVGGASALFLFQQEQPQAAGFALRAVGAVVFYSVISMYIMDHVRRDQIGRSEPQRLLSIGLAWTLGPFLGVQLEDTWGPWAPFLASVAASALLLFYFLALRFSNAPAIGTEAGKLQRLSWSQVRQYFAQPRLMLAWFHAAGRGFFWQTFNLYVPLFAVQTGLGAKTGGIMVGVGSSFMLAMPLWGWLARRYGIRMVSLICFPVACAGMLAAGLLTGQPWLAAAMIILATLSMSIVDGYGNALFLRACKPSQRTEMSPIFSTHRDVNDISQALMFAILLSYLPIHVVFIATAIAMAAVAVLVTRINPRL